jgi:hypothetical protein
MTDLTTRIANVKQKAEAAIEATTIAALTRDWGAFQDAASPDLFLAMAARIEELEKALKPFAGAYDYYKLWHPALLEDESASCMEYGHATIGHLRTAARALKGEG